MAQSVEEVLFEGVVHRQVVLTVPKIDLAVDTGGAIQQGTVTVSGMRIDEDAAGADMEQRSWRGV